MSSTPKRKRGGQGDDGSVSSALETPSKRKRILGNFRGAYVAVPRLPRHPRPVALADVSPRKHVGHSKETLEITSASVVTEMEEMNIDEEVIDESNLVLPEETREDEVDQELPVRYLDHFSIFDNETNQTISLDDAEDPKFGQEPYFIGRITAKWEPLDDEEIGSVETEGEEGDAGSTPLRRTEVTVKSSPIQLIWESTEPEGPFASDQSEIWIQTKFAWYILERPSKRYRELFLPRWLRHKLLLLIGYLAPKTDSVNRFQKRFLRDEAHWAEYEFGRKLTLEDLTKFIPQTLRYVTTLEDDIPAIYSSLFNKLCLEYCPKLSWSKVARSDDGYGTPSISSSRPRERPPLATQKDPRLTQTFCTPFIKTIAENYFPSLRDDEESSDEEPVQLEDTEPGDFVNIEPPRRLPRIDVQVKSITGNHENLAWIKVNKQVYRPGDTVFIRPENVEGMKKAEIRSGELRDYVWFGRIIRLYRECSRIGQQARGEMINNSDVYAHILWLLPASKTSIKELAHPQELIVINECDNDIPVESFIRVCQNKLLGVDEREPPATTNSLDFFYRYIWQRDDDDAFIDIGIFLRDRLLRTPIDTPCPACDSEHNHRLSNEPQKTESGVLLNKIEYHPLDFVYLLPDEPETEYHIGQIESIDCHEVKVRLLARKKQSSGYYDDRVLEYPPQTKLRTFPTDHLEGKCNVTRHKTSDLLENDRFFCPNMEHWQHCRLCDRSALSPPKVETLRGLDIFSGAGGLSLGLESIGLVKTQWAVEYDISSVRTFKKSHPNCVVYNACINALLRQAYDVQNGGKHTSVMSLEDGRTLPPFPEKGDVDIIYGGPPCQGFSRLNHCPKADDPRNHLVLTFISAIEMLQPNYVIMENVRGILSYRIGGRQASVNRIEGGIPCGMVKLVKRLLLSLNYQTRYGTLHAGHYGAPQIRRRVIFIASKRGTYLPDLPQPSHVTPNTRLLGVVIDEKHSFTVNKRRMNSAPLGAVTVGDVIGDLPQWEWKNPHLVYPATAHQKRDEKARMKSILTINGTHKPIETSLNASGPKHPMNYDIRPLTRYQLILRSQNKNLNQHWCPSFGEKEIERICTIPMVSDRFVDHNDLPSSLRIGLYGDKRHKGRYGRLHANGVFTTMLGTLVPNNPGGIILHPTLHRIITIREMARSQGFPDRIEFLLEPGSRNIKKITKQIGNAVPIPMAAAIGKEILNALRRTQQKDRGERESSVAL